MRMTRTTPSFPFSRFKHIKFVYKNKQYELYTDYRTLWTPHQTRLREYLPFEQFMNDYYQMYAQSPQEIQSLFDHNGKEFTKTAKHYLTPYAYLQEQTLANFTNEVTVLTLCRAALTSELVRDKAVYDLFIDTVSLRNTFVQLENIGHFHC